MKMKADRRMKMDGSERFRPKVARTGLENPDTGPDCGLGAGSRPARAGEAGRWAAAGLPLSRAGGCAEK